MIWLDPQATYSALLAVQALHLLHHRLAKRHISFAEVIGAAILCVPVSAGLPVWLYLSAHLGMIAAQIVGSIRIAKLSPDWQPREGVARSGSATPPGP